MVNQATIPVEPETRDRIRKIKGFERTYDELLLAWVEHAEEREYGGT